jgi:pimeloyl-ACP methyl ester carboxylesterase
MKTFRIGLVGAILLGFIDHTANCLSAPANLANCVAKVDAAYRNLPASQSAYNSAIREICDVMQTETPEGFAGRLKKLGVSFSSPKVELPLRHIEIVTAFPGSESTDIGIPVVLGYETKSRPMYPPEGLFVDATAVYDRADRHARFLLSSQRTRLSLNGRQYALAANNTAAGNYLKIRARQLAGSGFAHMIRPFSIFRKPQIYLLDPYDPKKTPLLMVHGLQSTPVDFAALVNSFRSDPDIKAKYQIWQFYYATGTPVLVNAAALRDSLAQAIHALDPEDRDAATKRIVVLGHSMGGVISHTLVSSSRSRVWASVFQVPPGRLKGDQNTIRELEHDLIFRRNPRIVRVIFMAAPHRGSPIADSFVGFLGNFLTRLDPMLEHGFSRLALANPNAMTPAAARFYRGGQFSAVRTLSPKSTALIALSRLPIEVPFHSIIGQLYPGPKERGSDGVVPYRSSRLEGAESEVIVRSGHWVFRNRDAVRETIRILHRVHHFREVVH